MSNWKPLHCGDGKLIGIQSGELKLTVKKKEGFFNHPSDHDKHCENLINTLNGALTAQD